MTLFESYSIRLKEFLAELYLLLVNRYLIKVSGEILIVVLGVGLVPLLDGRLGSASPGLLAELASLGQ